METFEFACPYFLMFGMTYEQFWDGDTSAHKMFLRKYQIESDQRTSDSERAAWMTGIYVTKAIGAAFNGRKSPYPKEPIKLFQTIAEQKAERKRELEDAAMNRAKASMEIFMINFNKRMNAKLDGKGGTKVASISTGD